MLRVLLLMGVSGTGKTLTGQELARRTGWDFRDADDFHSPASLGKMAAGIPLSEADRSPWIDLLNELVRSRCNRKTPAPPLVLACSALKSDYRRRILAGCPQSSTVFLQAAPATLSRRLRSRPGHFMPADLLQSQLDALEAPLDALSIDTDRPLLQVIEAILEHLQQTTDAPPPR